MADKFYSVIVGESAPFQVTEGASTSSEAIELRVSDSAYASKLLVLNGIEAIKNYMQATETNPVA